jgi:glycogen operon protein
MALPGDQIEETGEQGERITGDTFAILFNAHDDAVAFHLGSRDRKVEWEVEFDTADPEAPARHFAHLAPYPLQGRSLAVLRAIPLAPTSRSAITGSGPGT